MSDADAEWKRLVGEFVDACVQDQAKATQVLSQHPELRGSRWLGEPLLQFLVVEDFPDAVRFLASQGFDVDAEGGGPLCDAVTLGNAAMVEVLLGLGARVNVVGSLGLTPLQIAASNGRENLVRQLLAAGAAIAFGDTFGGTASVVETLCPEDVKESIFALLSAHERN